MEVDKELPTRPDSSSMRPRSGCSGRFYSTSNFDLWYFCSLLTYKNVQYLIWKILFISVWRMKAKAMAWLLTWFMIAQSTLISYHTEAFVKTESACTVRRPDTRLNDRLFARILKYVRHAIVWSLKFDMIDRIGRVNSCRESNRVSDELESG